MIKRIVLFVGYNFIFFTCFCFGLMTVVFVFDKVFSTTADPRNSTPVKFLVVQGDNLRTLAPRLYSEGLLRSPRPIIWLAMLKGDRMKEKLKKLQEGEYLIAPNMTPDKILRVLTSGDVVKYRVQIPEGKTVSDVIRLVSLDGLVDSTSFAIEINDRGFMQDLGIFTNSFEGFLFPETYYFTKPITARGIITTMVNEAKKRFLTDDSKARMNELGMTFEQVLTLASIIEKEAGNVEEMPVISSVFHNRLRLKMPLQSDPTVIYGIYGTISSDVKLTKEDLKRHTSYNTYVNKGLPPAPIANPGMAAFEAALRPADTKYLYFVAKGDGSGLHIFSENYEKHRSAVGEYRNNLANPVRDEVIAEIEAEEKKKQQEQEIDLDRFKKAPEKPKSVEPQKKLKAGDLISPIAPALKDLKGETDEDRQKKLLNQILN